MLSTTFNIPNFTGGAVPLGNGGNLGLNVGNYTSGSSPKITGTFSSANLNEPQNAYGTGAFALAGTFSTNRGRDYEGFTNGTKFTFDARRSSSAYSRDDNLIIPRGRACMYIIKY